MSTQAVDCTKVLHPEEQLGTLKTTTKVKKDQQDTEGIHEVGNTFFLISPLSDSPSFFPTFSFLFFNL